MRRLRFLLPLAVLISASAPSRDSVAKGIITVDVTSAADSAVTFTVVVRNGFVERDRDWGQAVKEFFTPQHTLDGQRIKARLPLDSLVVRTPARFFMFPQLASAQIRAKSGSSLNVRVTAWRGFTPLSGTGSELQVTTLDGRAAIVAAPKDR
jgi:hypothetical protein